MNTFISSLGKIVSAIFGMVAPKIIVDNKMLFFDPGPCLTYSMILLKNFPEYYNYLLVVDTTTFEHVKVPLKSSTIYGWNKKAIFCYGQDNWNLIADDEKWKKTILLGVADRGDKHHLQNELLVNQIDLGGLTADVFRKRILDYIGSSG